MYLSIREGLVRTCSEWTRLFRRPAHDAATEEGLVLDSCRFKESELVSNIEVRYVSMGAAAPTDGRKPWQLTTLRQDAWARS